MNDLRLAWNAATDDGRYCWTQLLAGALGAGTLLLFIIAIFLATEPATW